MHKHKLLLGAHISIAGGINKALTRATSIGCTTLQIFTKSNRQWAPQEPSPEAREAFFSAQKETGISMVVAHASYLINLGSPDADINRKSLVAAKKEFKVCDDLRIPYLVIHPGSYTTGTPHHAIKAIAEGINKILHHVPGSAMILLETMAGQGTAVGKTFKELAEIRDLVTEKNRVGICLDTCHVFAAGYDISTKQGYDSLWKDFQRDIGLSHLKVIHMNDSKRECGSQVDRHEEIGKGEIGLAGFRLLMNDERLISVPKILETPKADLEDDARNMRTLKSLISPETKQKIIE